MCVYKGVPVYECVSIYRQGLCLGSLTVTHCLEKVWGNIACIVEHFASILVSRTFLLNDATVQLHFFQTSLEIDFILHFDNERRTCVWDFFNTCFG